jgi:hypothetical protein
VAYLGKISAIVSANPLNFQKGLSDAAASARLFGQSVKSNIQSSMRDSEKSFSGIMTQAQKLKASLDAAVANKIKFVGFAGLDAEIAPAVTRVRELANVAETINKPLGGAAAKFSQMSHEIQASFLPALVAAQQKVFNLRNEINAGKPISDAYFKQIATQALAAAEAVDRLAEAAQLANQTQVSKSFAFVDPANEAALQRMVQAQKKASAAPLSLRMDGSFRSAQIEVEKLSQELVAISAELARFHAQGIDAPDVLVNRMKGTQTAANAASDNLSGLMPRDDGLGKAMGDASRQSDVLKGKINTLKGQLDQLDDPIRSAMIPAIEQMEAHFRSGLPSAINASIASAKELERDLARIQKASTIKTSGAIIDDAAINRSMGRLSGMEQVLLRVGAQAGSATALGFDRLANATRTAVQAGTLGLPTTIELLNRLEKEAVQAAAATGRISVGSAMAAVNRAGDVGRVGMNKFSMGLNQAMFAVDDFFSSVGGVEQKIRAVSNNVTQLGFVVGNTKGLFVALAAVVVSQVGLAIYKYMNDGRSAEDVTKSLNDALSRQKSLLESLAQAYDSLADSIGKSGMSDKGKKEFERKKEFDDIRKKQKEIRDEAIQSLSPKVNTERANQAKLQRELEKEETAGGRVAIQRKIDESKVRENRMKDEVVAEPPKTIGQVRKLFAKNEAALLLQRDKSLLRDNLPNKLLPEVVNRTALALPKGVSKEKQVEALTIQSKELEKQANTFSVYFSFLRSTFNAQIAEIKSTIDKINSSAEEINQEALNKILPALRGVGDVLESGQENLKQALGEDIGSSSLASKMTELSDQIKAQTELATKNSNDPKTLAQVEAKKSELEKLAAGFAGAVMSVEIFSDAMKKISDTLQSDLGEFQKLADTAREEDIRLGTPETAGRRKAADKTLREMEERKAKIEDELKYAREKAKAADPTGRQEKMQSLAAEILDKKTTEERRFNARRQLKLLRDAENAAIENSPEVMQAKAGMDVVTKDQQEKKAAVRGRDLAKTATEKRNEDLKMKADDLAAASREAEKAQAGSGQALAQQGAEQMALAAAPMLAGFRDEVMNARLQGPSRQALKVSDTTTSEGQAELQRLLRGDDASKDINLVELQQQTASLREIVNILRVDHNIIVDL